MPEESATPGGQGPLDGDNFEATWEAAQRGDFRRESDAPPDASAQAAPEVANSPALAANPDGAAVVPGQEQPPAEQAWSPPTREQWEETQRKARHFDSFNGNFPKIEQRWEQEKLTPLQEQIRAIEAERDRFRQERETALETYINSRPPAEQAVLRQRVAEYDAEQNATITRQREEQERINQLAQREQQVQAGEQRILAQETDNLRMTVKGSVEPYAASLADTYGVPVAEIKQYITSLELNDFIDQAAPHELIMVGPMMRAVEKHAQLRGTQIAAENARRKTDAGTYRTEGIGAGAGGERRSVADLPDKDFEALWEAVKGGGQSARP